jgi:hypothetical protein
MTYNIPCHRRGDTWGGIASITIRVNGVPVNLTGSSIKMEFRRSIDSPVMLTFSTSDNTIQLLSQSSIRVMPRKIEIPFGTYLYDLQVTYPTGVVRTFVSGEWEITPDITE